MIPLLEQIELRHHLVGTAARRGRIIAMEQRPNDHIVLHRKRRKRPNQLKRATDSAPADLVGLQIIDALTGKNDAAPVRRGRPGDHVEQRRLAGSVWPNHRGDGTGCNAKAHLIDRKHAAKALADGIDGQKRVHAPFP